MARTLATMLTYVRRHNLADGRPPDPWPFIIPFTAAGEIAR